MKFKTLVFSLLFMNVSFGFSKAEPQEKPAVPNTQSVFGQLAGSFLYSYTGFKFNSTTGSNFNRFRGHSNLYAVGGDNLHLFKDLSGGVFVFKSDTDVNAHVYIAPGSLAHNSQSIHNQSLFSHVLKAFNEHYFVDLAGAYGENHVNTQSILKSPISSTQIGYAENVNHNWFTLITGLYRNSWGKLLVSGTAGVLYSQVNTGLYTFHYAPTLEPQIVNPLVNKTTQLIENAELGYQVKPNLRPFVNAGLIQVVQFSNSRPTYGSVINGALPQLNMDKNGYKVGGGLGFDYKKLIVRLEQQYYNAGGTYTSNQTLLSFRYMVV